VACLYGRDGSLRAVSRTNFDAAKGETVQNVSLGMPDDYDVDFELKIFLTTGYGIRILDEENIL